MKFPKVSQTTLILIVSIFISVFHNFAYFKNIAAFYSSADTLSIILVATGIFHATVLVILLSFAGTGQFLKVILSALLVISAATAYFTDTYNVIIDSEMLVNVLQTNTSESFDLVTGKFFVYLLILGLLPAALVFSLQLTDESMTRILLKRTGLIFASFTILAMTVFAYGDFFSSFIREQKELRFYATPTKALESVYKLSAAALKGNPHTTWQTVAEDAQKSDEDDEFELVVLVIGETARAENFSLNGYQRKTNPKLEQQKLISFTNVQSCGTTTAVSVPCMFSFRNRAEYDRNEAASMDNILDVLKRSGVEVLWRDNNSGSKGVADRVTYQDFSSPDINPVCDTECRDEGMLSGLDEWIAQHGSSDMLIVMHQLGSHGPAYYKRYPPEFEQFKPTCQTSQLDQCTEQQIVNTYDNTILYTDHFLNKIISWLKQKDRDFEVSMMYVSDHGESLGESGLYLHGFPYALAPDQQTHVPAILWGGTNNSDIDFDKIRSNFSKPISHDNLAQTLLGLFEVQSKVYNPSKDILKYQYRYQ